MILLILAVPLAALAVGFFLFHRRKPSLTHWPILLSCAIVTACAWTIAAQLLQGAPGFEQTLWRWIGFEGFAVEFGLRVDGLGMSVLAMVTLVGSLIHLYAVGYMRNDAGFSRFFLYFHLFFFSMLGLLLSNNYLQLYLFWEGVGVASYLLIGFWYGKETAQRAALKAFITNRVGDACFLIALFLLVKYTGTLNFQEVFSRLDLIPSAVLPWIAGLLFAGASAKSAQFPLYIWLPDAMEGPTPTSALMHAATMVTAGVFLMARSWPILERVPMVLDGIAVIGVITALGAAILAFTKKDLKRILAYSTVSHLGLMMLAIGCGNVFAATAHLIMHGFFKAALFLCAGNVLHAIGKPSASVDEAGGMAKEIPLTTGSFVLAALALAGIPPLAGFFSKDLVLESVVHKSWIFGLCAGAVAVGSGLYIGRMFWLTFCGKRPEQKHAHHGEHHSDPVLEWPVAALAGLSAAAGLVLVPTGILHRLFSVSPLWTGQPFPEAHFDWTLAAFGLIAALLGVGISWYLGMARPSWDWDWRKSNRSLESWMDKDLGWQPLISNRLAGAVAALGNFTGQTFDLRIWDKFAESFANSFVVFSEKISISSRGLLNQYIWWMALGVSLFMLGLLWAR